jgi:hypothetical protein
MLLPKNPRSQYDTRSLFLISLVGIGFIVLALFQFVLFLPPGILDGCDGLFLPCICHPTIHQEKRPYEAEYEQHESPTNPYDYAFVECRSHSTKCYVIAKFANQQYYEKDHGTFVG